MEKGRSCLGVVACFSSFWRCITTRHLAWGIGFFGLFSFCVALAWEHSGAKPCILCHVERWMFLAGGLLAFVPLFFRGLTAQRLLALTTAVWCGLVVVVFYHYGIQMRWFHLPNACHFSMPDVSIVMLERLLSTRTQAACSNIPFSFLGQPPTFYILFTALKLAILGLWGFLRRAPQAMKKSTASAKRSGGTAKASTAKTKGTDHRVKSPSKRAKPRARRPKGS